MATTKKISELTALTSAANTDLLYIVHDPAGVPTSNKITVQNLLKTVNAQAIDAKAANAYTNAVAAAANLAANAYTNSIALFGTLAITNNVLRTTNSSTTMTLRATNTALNMISNTYVQLHYNANSSIGVEDGSGSNWLYVDASGVNMQCMNSTGEVVSYISLSNSALAMAVNGQVLTLREDGSIVPPTGSINHAGSGNILTLGNNQNQIIITGPAPNSTYMTAQRLVVQGQQGYDTGEGGDIYLWAGHSGANGGTGGDIKIDAGAGYNNSDGGGIKIRGGASTGATGGYVEIWSGSGSAGANITMSTWSGSAWNQWTLTPAGGILFPDGSEQDTAYTGVQNTVLVTTATHQALYEEIILCDPNAAGEDILVYLPNSAVNGKVFTVKNINDGGHKVEVQANGSPTIIESGTSGATGYFAELMNSGNAVSWVYYGGYYRIISSR